MKDDEGEIGVDMELKEIQNNSCVRFRGYLQDKASKKGGKCHMGRATAMKTKIWAFSMIHTFSTAIDQ